MYSFRYKERLIRNPLLLAHKLEIDILQLRLLHVNHIFLQKSESPIDWHLLRWLEVDISDLGYNNKYLYFYFAFSWLGVTREGV